MFATLLDFGGQQGVAFVYFPDAVEHFGQFGREPGLAGDLDDGLGVEPNLLHDLDVVVVIRT